MTLSDAKGNCCIYDRNCSIKLPCERAIICPPLKYAVLPHGLIASSLGGLAIILPLPGVFLNKALWIGVERVQSGEVFTTVFNMSNLNVRVKKGEAVSELVLLAGPEPLSYGGSGEIKIDLSGI